MHEYHYAAGNWSRMSTRTVSLNAREAGPQLAELGFDEYPYDKFGPRCGFSELELHPAADGSVEIPDGNGGVLLADFAVVLCPVEMQFVVYVRDLPSLLSLAREVEALARMEALARSSDDENGERAGRAGGVGSLLTWSRSAPR